MMRLWSFIRVVFLGGLLLLTGCQNSPLQTGDIDGVNWHWSDSSGTGIVVVNYWASWCHECTKEIPALNTVFAQSKKNGFVFLSVNMDDVPVERVRALRDSLDIKYPILAENPNTQLGISDPVAVPAFYFFTPAGKLLKIVYRHQDLNAINVVIAELHAPR